MEFGPRLARDFLAALETREFYDEMCSDCTINYAPGLEDVLHRAKCPDVNFFTNLPMISLDEQKKSWGIYAHVMSKPGRSKKFLYIGSATNQKGMHLRREVYKKPDDKRLPSLIAPAFEAGYDIEHTGLLCWVGTSVVSKCLRTRARFIALEALFCGVFFACVKEQTDAAVFKSTISPIVWSRQEVNHGPLCSYLPLYERLNGSGGGGPALVRTEEEQRAHDIAAAEYRRKNENALHQRWRARQHDADPEAYNARRMKDNREYRAKIPERVAEWDRTRAARVKKEKKFYCEACDVSCVTPASLKIHMGRERHLQRVADLASGHSSRSSGSARTAKYAAHTQTSRMAHRQTDNNSSQPMSKKICISWLSAHLVLFSSNPPSALFSHRNIKILQVFSLLMHQTSILSRWHQPSV